MLRRALVVAFVSSFAALSACSHEQSGPHPVTMSTSDKVPAASGAIEVVDAGNGNNSLHVAVAHMAPADRIAAGATTYVVWVRPLAADGRPQNVGAIKVDQNLQGALDTLTPLKHFEVFVTPEPSPSVQKPGGQALLWGRFGE